MKCLYINFSVNIHMCVKTVSRTILNFNLNFLISSITIKLRIFIYYNEHKQLYNLKVSLICNTKCMQYKLRNMAILLLYASQFLNYFNI